MAADDVATAVGRVAEGPPANGVVEVAGPEQSTLDGLIQRFLSARGDPRHVQTDPKAPYFGAVLSERTLVPGDGAILGEIRLADWLRQSASTTQATA